MEIKKEPNKIPQAPNNESDEIQKIAKPLVIEEVSALIRYASEQGIDRKLKDTERDLLPDSERTGSHQNTILTALNSAVYAYTNKGSEPERANDIIRLYTMLSKMTKPVNGRTLLDTVRAKDVLYNIFLLTIVLLGLAIIEVVLSYWWAETVTPEEGLAWWLGVTLRDILTPVSPFLWGGLGACVYLLKRLYDISEKRYYDRQRMRSWMLRVLLGAIMGFVVVQLFELSVVGDGESPLKANAVAFLVGLGAKIVYGALEKLVLTMSEKLNLDTVRQTQSPTSEVHAFLNQRLAEAMADEDSPRRKLYESVIEDLGRTESKG